MATSKETPSAINLTNSSVDKEQEDEYFSYACHLVLSTILPMTLQAAVELDVFEIMAEAGANAKLSASQIASRMPTTNPNAPAMLDRILRLLATHSVVHCISGDDGDGKLVRLYSLAPVSKYFIRDSDGASLGSSVALSFDKVFLDCWTQLKPAVLEGGTPFIRVYGAQLFEYLGKDLRLNQAFNTSLFNYTTIVMKKILESYRGFDNLKQVIDVGGGHGITLGMIISKYPSIKGVNFDLPHVIKDAPSFPGIEHVIGDMFESVPKGDALLLKCVLHDWNDEQCLKLLKNCYKSIPNDGKVIVIEEVLPFVPDSSASVQSGTERDVLMMCYTPGGRERTQEEFTALATGAGFEGIRFECFVCNFWVMEFFK